MTEITENSYVNVEGWTQEEVGKAAEIFAEALDCRVGDVEIMEGHYYLFKYMYTMFVGTSLDCSLTLENPIELTKEEVFANETVDYRPPVGVECEWKDTRYGLDWQCVKVIAYYDGLAWLEYLENGGPVIVNINEGVFRQIDEDKKDKENSIQAMHQWMKINVEGFLDAIDNMPARDFYEYLYESGWRITEK